MASFPIQRRRTTDLENVFSNLKLGPVYKDYRKNSYPVYWDNDKELCLKIESLNVLFTPKEGDKFIYAEFGEPMTSHDFLRSLDKHFGSVFPEHLDVKPAFGKVIKLYLPYTSKKLNYSKITIYDSEKKEQDISTIKENSKIKVLAYLKKYKKYSEEVIPVWQIRQVIIQSDKEPISLIPPPEEPVPENVELLEDYATLETREKILLDNLEDSDFSDTE